MSKLETVWKPTYAPKGTTHKKPLVMDEPFITVGTLTCYVPSKKLIILSTKTKININMGNPKVVLGAFAHEYLHYLIHVLEDEETCLRYDTLKLKWGVLS